MKGCRELDGFLMEGDDWPPLRATAKMGRRRESATHIYLNDLPAVQIQCLIL